MANSRYLTYKPDDSLERPVIIVSKKVAHLAVNRNKLKRRIREILRETHHTGYVYTRAGAAERSFKELREELVALL